MAIESNCSNKATGQPISSYIYDKNGNRISSEENGVVTTATYDDQDRVISFGTNTYTYNANGEMASKVNAALALTQFAYDSTGMLVSVTSPSNTVTYGIDADGRRVERKVGGSTNLNLIWDGSYKLLAMTDNAGVVTKKFVYADDHTPEYMDHLGNNYLLMKDNKGSIIGALNTSSGKMSQAMTYSEWGAVLTDTSAGFQPFGFAGGLYDGTTKTLRFGAREYDPEIGRWTTKDPIGFEGGDGNLYGYVLNDPVNLVDPKGKNPFEDGEVGANLGTAIYNIICSYAGCKQLPPPLDPTLDNDEKRRVDEERKKEEERGKQPAPADKCDLNRNCCF